MHGMVLQLQLAQPSIWVSHMHASDWASGHHLEPDNKGYTQRVVHAHKYKSYI